MISGIGGNSALGGGNRSLPEQAKKYIGEANGRIDDSAVRQDITHHCMNDKAFQLTLARGYEEAASGNANGHLASMFKYYGSEQNKRKFELLLQTMGTTSVGWEGDSFTSRELSTTRPVSYTHLTLPTIYSV